MQSYWWLFAFSTAPFIAATSLLNEHYRLDGLSLVLVRSIFIAILMGIIGAAFIAPPSSSIFYVTAAGSGINAAIADSLIFNAAARLGSGPVSRAFGIVPFLSFFGWYLIHPSDLTVFAMHPAITVGIAFSLVACFFSLYHLNRCHLSRSALLYIIPTAGIYAVNDVLNKTAQSHAGSGNGAFYYTFAASLVTMLTIPLIARIRKKPYFSGQPATLLKVGLCIAIVHICAMMLRNISMTYAPNPAYPGLLAMTAFLWIRAWHIWKKKIDGSDIRSGLIFAFATLCLVAFNQALQH